MLLSIQHAKRNVLILNGVVILQNIIQALRHKENLTQKELAQVTEISERNIQAIEAGQIDPRTSNSIKIAKALKTTVEALYDSKKD